MRCSQPGVPGATQGRARVFGIAAIGGELLGRRDLRRVQVGQVVGIDDPPRLGAVGQEAVGEEHHRRHVLRGQADRLEGHRQSNRRAWPRPAPPAGTRRAARDMAISRSDCSVLVGMPVLGPARCTSMTTSGNSVITARPRPSAFSDEARAAGAGGPDGAGERGADGGHAGGDFVLGLERADVVLLVLRQLVQDLAGRRDRIAGIDQRAAGPVGRRPPGPGRPPRCPSRGGSAPWAAARPPPCAARGTARPCRQSCSRPAGWRRWPPSSAGSCGTSSISHSSTGWSGRS